MSSKQAKKQFVMPKLPPDLIVTRRKAQTQMKSTKKAKTLKCTTLPKKRDVTMLKKTLKKVDKKVSCSKLAADKEYHTNKLKRNVTAKKIVLKPKYNMKFVAGINKRKRGTPQKDIASIEATDHMQTSPWDSDLSMCDAVRLLDETTSLTDEDLMEILTCPSPVWWEDPPYAEYIEDALPRLPCEKTVKAKQLDSNQHTQKSPNSQHNTRTSSDREKNTQKSPNSQHNTRTSSDKEQNTQKSKSQYNTRTSSDKEQNTQKSRNSQQHTEISPNSLQHTQTSPDSHIDFEQEINQFKILTDKFNQKKTKLEHVLGNIINKANRQDKRRLSESTEGDDIFSDLSLNEEDILKQLENIDIPIEDPKSEENGRVDENPLITNDKLSRNGQDETANVEVNESGEPSRHEQNSNMNEEKKQKVGINKKNIGKNGLKGTGNKLDIRRVVVNISNTPVKGAKKNLNCVLEDAKTSLVHNGNSIKRSVTNNTCTDYIGRNVNKRVRRIKKDAKFTGLVRNDLVKNDFDVKIPSDLPPLKRRPSLKSVTKKIACNELNIDSISDVNIKFISDEESIDGTCKDDLGVNSNEITGKNEFPKKLITDLTEYITVYKIMSNDDKKKLDNDELTKKNDKLNDFLKKCSGNKRLKKENTVSLDGEIKKSDNSDATDFDEQNRPKGCDYCISKTEQGETDFSCDTCNMAPIFSCDLCNFRSNTKEIIKNHVSRCNKVNRAVVMC